MRELHAFGRKPRQIRRANVAGAVRLRKKQPVVVRHVDDEVRAGGVAGRPGGIAQQGTGSQARAEDAEHLD